MDDEDPNDLLRSTRHHFSKGEVDRLWRRFHAIGCRTTRGSVGVPVVAILALPELAAMPFARRVAKITCLRAAAEHAAARAAEAAAAAADDAGFVDPDADIAAPVPDSMGQSEEVVITIEEDTPRALGLQFGVDPETAQCIVIGMSEEGAVEACNPGILEVGDVLREIEGRSVATFGEIDKDHSQTISREEAMGALAALRDVPPSDDFVDELWLSCDEDGDGTVSFTEFKSKLAEVLLEEAMKLLSRQSRPFKIIFARPAEEKSESDDEESDGVFSDGAEYIVAADDGSTERGAQRRPLAEYSGAAVRFRTFVRVVSALCVKASVEEKVGLLFDACDANGDGKVGATDFFALMAPAAVAGGTSAAMLELRSSAMVRALQAPRWAIGGASKTALRPEELTDGAFRGEAAVTLELGDVLSNEFLAAELAARLSVAWR